MKNKLLIIAIFIVLQNLSFARDCRSELGAALKPIYPGAPILWGVELSTTYGEMHSTDIDRIYNNQHLFIGLELNIGKNKLYFEPSLKYWDRSDPPPKTVENIGPYPMPERRNVGMRELSLSRQLKNGNLTFGLQSMEFSGSSLLDERVIGVNLNKTLSSIDFELNVGTVSTDFARMEDFCGTRHVYRVVKRGPFSLISDQPGETNFAGVKLTWTPGKKVSNSTSTDSEDEFSDFDEFSESDEFSDISDTEIKKKKFINNIGFLMMQEFGKGFDGKKLYLGPTLSLSLPFSFELNNELIFQHISQEQNLAFICKLNRNFNWKSGALTQFALGYYGAFGINSGSRFYPAFSSLYIGEVMRLDAMDMSFVQLSVNQKMPLLLHPSIKLSYMQQTELNHTSEIDIQLGLEVFKGFKVWGIYSNIKSDELKDAVNMMKFEVRWGI